MDRKAEMFELIKAWQESGQTQATFIRKNGVSFGTFYYWLKKYRSQPGKAKDTSCDFTPVYFDNLPVLKNKAKVIEIKTPSGICVTVYE